MKNMGCLVVMIVGLLMMGIAITLAVTNSDFKKNALSAEGMVIDLALSKGDDGGAYAPIVRFVTASGDTVVFTDIVYTDPPAYHVDEVVTVLYHAESPDQAKISSFFSLYSGSLILFILGLCIAVPSYYFFAADRKEMKELEFYLSKGIKIEATLAGVEQDSTADGGDKHLYYIIAEKNINGGFFRFKSKSYLRDPSPYLKNIETIVVYRHPYNTSKYLMDTSFMPY